MAFTTTVALPSGGSIPAVADEYLPLGLPRKKYAGDAGAPLWVSPLPYLFTL
jgi:hypothetical protein